MNVEFGSFRNRRYVVWAMASVVACVAAGLLSTSHAAAYGATMNVSIASTMTLSRSAMEVEFPVTVTCDPIGRGDSYVYVQLSQTHTNATGSQAVRPLVCDSTPHAYVAHVFADAAGFQDGPTSASAVAQNNGPNFIEQSGSAATTTKLVQGPVAVTANDVTGAVSGTPYSISIGDRATLKYPTTNGQKGYAEALLAVTVVCAAPNGDGFIGVALEEADGNRAIVGSDRGSTVQEPTLICDGVPHTYSWILFGITNSAPYDLTDPGDLSACAWVENDSSRLPGSTGAPNADAVTTVHATNG